MLNQQLNFKMKRKYRASGLAEFKEEWEKKKVTEEVKNDVANDAPNQTEKGMEIPKVGTPPQTPPHDLRFQMREISSLLTGLKTTLQLQKIRT